MKGNFDYVKGKEVLYLDHETNDILHGKIWRVIDRASTLYLVDIFYINREKTESTNEYKDICSGSYPRRKFDVNRDERFDVDSKKEAFEYQRLALAKGNIVFEEGKQILYADNNKEIVEGICGLDNYGNKIIGLIGCEGVIYDFTKVKEKCYETYEQAKMSTVGITIEPNEITERIESNLIEPSEQFPSNRKIVDFIAEEVERITKANIERMNKSIYEKRIFFQEKSEKEIESCKQNAEKEKEELKNEFEIKVQRLTKQFETEKQQLIDNLQKEYENKFTEMKNSSCSYLYKPAYSSCYEEQAERERQQEERLQEMRDKERGWRIYNGKKQYYQDDIFDSGEWIDD